MSGMQNRSAADVRRANGIHYSERKQKRHMRGRRILATILSIIMLATLTPQTAVMANSAGGGGSL
jgi:hypothetical protein